MQSNYHLQGHWDMWTSRAWMRTTNHSVDNPLYQLRHIHPTSHKSFWKLLCFSLFNWCKIQVCGLMADTGRVSMRRWVTVLQLQEAELSDRLSHWRQVWRSGGKPTCLPARCVVTHGRRRQEAEMSQQALNCLSRSKSHQTSISNLLKEARPL